MSPRDARRRPTPVASRNVSASASAIEWVWIESSSDPKHGLFGDTRRRASAWNVNTVRTKALQLPARPGRSRWLREVGKGGRRSAGCVRAFGLRDAAAGCRQRARSAPQTDGNSANDSYPRPEPTTEPLTTPTTTRPPRDVTPVDGWTGLTPGSGGWACLFVLSPGPPSTPSPGPSNGLG